MVRLCHKSYLSCHFISSYLPPPKVMEIKSCILMFKGPGQKQFTFMQHIKPSTAKLISLCTKDNCLCHVMNVINESAWL